VDGDLLFGLPVHPLADLFPMLPEDELADLADDIKANGLLHPAMLDNPGKMLVDGRNRLRACEIAGVEPRFERLPKGTTPAAYIASANLRRRNLTKGQQAMATAMIYPAPAKGGRGNKSSINLAESANFSQRRLNEARLILAHSIEGDLAGRVLAGMAFDDALSEAQRRRQAVTAHDAQLARVQREAPDVADLIAEGTISLAAGLAELDERERNKRNTIESGRRSAERIATSFAADAIAILSAMELGEVIELDAGQQAQIKQTLELLSKEGVI
jgi:hypothetical protein